MHHHVGVEGGFGETPPGFDVGFDSLLPELTGLLRGPAGHDDVVPSLDEGGGEPATEEPASADDGDDHTTEDTAGAVESRRVVPPLSIPPGPISRSSDCGEQADCRGEKDRPASDH